LNPKPKQVFIITSARLLEFAEVNYKRVFKVEEIPKGGIEIFEKGIYIYTENGSRYHQERVDFKPPFEDIIAIKKKNRQFKRMQSLTRTDHVFCFADFDFEYSQHILWELHHEFKIHFSQMYYVRDFKTWSFFVDSNPYYDVKKRLETRYFSPRVVRTMVALSLLKLAIYQYSLHHIYGPPLNIASLITIKLNHEGIHMKRHDLEVFIRHLDISLYSVKTMPKIHHPIIKPRLYSQFATDIKGFDDKDFLIHLMELRDLFAKQLISYQDYKKELITIFDLEEGQL
jgi:hypothetical protein